MASPHYPGYQWEDKERTRSCSYLEAVAGEDGRCVRSNSTTVRTCTQGPYIFDDFEFSETTVTRFNILCGNEHFYKSVSLGCGLKVKTINENCFYRWLSLGLATWSDC